jgi:hypothetical protein
LFWTEIKQNTLKKGKGKVGGALRRISEIISISHWKMQIILSSQIIKHFSVRLYNTSIHVTMLELLQGASIRESRDHGVKYTSILGLP